MTSCSSWKKIELDNYLQKSNCFQQQDYDYTLEDLPIPIHELELDSMLLNNFSFNSLNIAHSFGFLGEIENYLQILITEESPNLSAVELQLKKLELRQKLNHYINMASIDVSAIASEMDCEEERADQIASYLARKDAKAENRLTVSAIISGAIGTIGAAIIVLNDPEDNRVEYFGIGVGITEVLFGTLLLTNERKVYIYHERNALRELWEGQTISSIFPPPIWYYLNYYNPNNFEEDSKRNIILEKWMKFGQISESKEKKKDELIALYFKDGGYYNSIQLENRANMHDQIESQINLMKQQLKSLALELDIFEKKLNVE